jgi:hypothetical protein
MRYNIFFRQSDENQGKHDSQYSWTYSSSTHTLSLSLALSEVCMTIIFIQIILSWQAVTDIFTYGILRTAVMEMNFFCLKRGQTKL